MDRTIKNLALILMVTLAMQSVIASAAVSAQTTPKPGVPEFSLKYVDYSYTIPAEYGVDQFTGQTIITKYEQHFDNRTIEITIKNQPFNNYTDSNGREIDLFYSIRYKGMYTDDWTEIYGGRGKMVMYHQNDVVAKKGYPIQNYGAQSTKILFPVSAIPNNVQLQFQVEALAGYTTATITDGRILFSIVDYTFTGQTSGWSNPQTITVGEVSTPNTTNPTSPSTQTPNPTPDNATATPSENLTGISLPDNALLSTFAVVVAVLMVVIASLIFYIKTLKKQVASAKTQSSRTQQGKEAKSTLSCQQPINFKRTGDKFLW